LVYLDWETFKRQVLESKSKKRYFSVLRVEDGFKIKAVCQSSRSAIITEFKALDSMAAQRVIEWLVQHGFVRARWVKER